MEYKISKRLLGDLFYTTKSISMYRKAENYAIMHLPIYRTLPHQARDKKQYP